MKAMQRAPGVAALALSLAAAAPALADGDAAPGHLIYLHGRIIQEQQSPRPEHPKFGPYEMERILEAFRRRGFEVTGEIRPKETTVAQAADRVVDQVRRLQEAGVPARKITVVGGSMGGGIATLAAARLREPAMRFVTLGSCLSRSVEGIKAATGSGPLGFILSIREASDGATEPCPAWEPPAGDSPAPVVRELVLKTGLEHGFLYRPLPEWLEPAVSWAEEPGAGSPHPSGSEP